MENLKSNSSIYTSYLPANLKYSPPPNLEDNLQNSNTLSQLYPNNLLGNFFSK